ncbi:hypothetical protein ACFSO9_12075 [Mesonia maritima]|uniref:hypothetical protein n=1 Tax=Mesonia maritima TaxID=1793873 RepID=UPI00363D0252
MNYRAGSIIPINDVPDRSIILLGVLAGILAIIGSLSSLVEAASLAFLFTFGIVNWIAYRELNKKKWIPLLGIIIGCLVGGALIFRLIISKPIALGGILAIVLLIILGRPYVLKQKEKTKQKSKNEEK